MYNKAPQKAKPAALQPGSSPQNFQVGVREGVRPKLPRQVLDDTGLLMYEDDGPQSGTEEDDVDEKAAARVKRQLDFGSQKGRFEDSDVMMPLGQERMQQAAKRPRPEAPAKIGAGLGTAAKKERDRQRDLVLGVSIDSGTFDASILADQSMHSRKSRKKK